MMTKRKQQRSPPRHQPSTLLSKKNPPRRNMLSQPNQQSMRQHLPTPLPSSMQTPLITKSPCCKLHPQSMKLQRITRPKPKLHGITNQSLTTPLLCTVIMRNSCTQPCTILRQLPRITRVSCTLKRLPTRRPHQSNTRPPFITRLPCIT